MALNPAGSSSLAAGMPAVGGMNPSMEINHAAKHGDVVRKFGMVKAIARQCINKPTHTQLLH